MSKQIVTSGRLISTVAEALRLPEKRVAYAYRVLREHGEVSIGKRGFGASAVTTRDAAKTIVAVASSFMLDEIIKSVRSYGNAPLIYTAATAATQDPEKPEGVLTAGDWTEREGGSWVLEGLSIPALQSLPPRHTVVDALTAMIEAIRDREFSQALTAAFPGKQIGLGYEVHFDGPSPGVGMSVTLTAAPGFDYEEHATYFPPTRYEDYPDDPRIQIRVSVATLSLGAIAGLFAEAE